MRSKLIQSLLASVLAAGACSSAHAQLTQLNYFNANQGSGLSAGEIVAFDKVTDRLFVTSSGNGAQATGVHQVNIFEFTTPGSQTSGGVIDYSTAFGAKVDMRGLSSVAVDPLNRFGVVSLIPTANATTLGKVGFFNLSTGASLGTVDVGYHPDSVTFSADGSKLIVVNEGEFNPNLNLSDGTIYTGTNTGNVNAPGSISIIDVSGITSGNLASLTGLAVTTKDFSAENLASGVSIAALRNSNVSTVGTTGTFIGTVPVFNTADIGAIEPEYASVKGDKVYVSLQDNNAIAEYDLTSGKWTEVKSLGTIAQTIDATDTGSTTSISQVVKGLPMPDTVATFVSGGKTYVVSANEGDARVDDRDMSRFGDVSGSDSMNPILDAKYPTTATGVRDVAELGRLNVSRLDGDTNGDGLIDEPTMIGTRSFSIYEKTEGGLVRVYDSGSFFETYIAANGGWQDSRSDDKGPEPEGLTIGEINGRTYLFIGMERTAHIFQFDITNPLGVTFVDAELLPFADAQRPEGFLFISAADSPNGQNLLVVGYEGAGSSTTEKIGVFTVIPEPSAYAAIAGGVLFGFAALRRRRARA